MILKAYGGDIIKFYDLQTVSMVVGCIFGCYGWFTDGIAWVLMGNGVSQEYGFGCRRFSAASWPGTDSVEWVSGQVSGVV